MKPLAKLDISSLNRLFLEMSRDFREGVRTGKKPEELSQLQTLLYQVHEELRARRFRYSP
ncbi:MAG: hypothetical protein K0Q66_1707 [Chitinophagaceae bacterium]|jgi:hypothetical protein|nr:hypothetical protein [Chitinophagaceae bacterium]